MKTIKVSDWTIAPRLGLRSEGKFSGQEYREEVLAPALEAALRNNEKLRVNLEGTLPYYPHFLRQAFGGLVEQFRLKNDIIQKLSEVIEIYAPNHSLYANRAQAYILEAESED